MSRYVDGTSHKCKDPNILLNTVATNKYKEGGEEQKKMKMRMKILDIFW